MAATNLVPLTSIRFFAALRVAMYHCVDWDSSGYWWRGLMATPASVSYFFVSSGFLLTYSYAQRFDHDELRYGTFWLGRCLRLLPVYYLGLLVALPLSLRAHELSAGKALLTVLVLQSWSPHTALYWNYPAWALSNLAFCYFTLPFLLRITRGRSRMWWLMSAAVAWIISLALSFTYFHWNPDGLTQINTSSEGFWLYVLKFNPLVHVPEFFIGMIAGRIFTASGPISNREANFSFILAACAILYILLLGYRIPYPVTHTGLLAPLLAIVVISIASGGFAASILRARWLVILGQSSFALYMLHAPLMQYVVWKWSDNKSPSHAAKLATVAAIVAISLAMYKWVEAPVTAALRGRFFKPLPSVPKIIPAS
ncbi:MAG: acyltransferase [Acidobacteriota bacterium]|nr:acyltransferase [Acidobacteriota bacterium]